jgi:hypothetical protein
MLCGFLSSLTPFGEVEISLYRTSTTKSGYWFNEVGEDALIFGTKDNHVLALCC